MVTRTATISFFIISTHLLQRCVGHAKAAEADINKGLLQLPEEASIGPRLEVTVGQQIGQLLANSLDETSLWHVMMDKGCDAFHVTWKQVIRLNHQTCIPF